MKLARQKRSKYYSEVTRMMGMDPISAHTLDPFRKLRSFRKWDTGRDINPEDETSYTIQYHEAFLKYLDNQYFAKHRRVPVNKHESLPMSNIIPSATASASWQSSFDPYDLSSDDEEYSMPNYVAETTPGRSDCAALVLATGPNSRFGSRSGSNPEPNRCNVFPHTTWHFNITTLPPIKYLNSDRMMI